MRKSAWRKGRVHRGDCVHWITSSSLEPSDVGRGMRAWPFRGAWGKTNLVIPGSSLVLIKQTPRTKDRFLSQHMAFIHIIDVPYRDFLIFHMHMMYLNKMYQGILFHTASSFYKFSVCHPFRWFACALWGSTRGLRIPILNSNGLNFGRNA